MIGQFIHRHLQRLRIKSRHIMPHGAKESICIPDKISSVFIAVFLHTGQKPGEWFHKCIVVHHGIPLITF